MKDKSVVSFREQAGWEADVKKTTTEIKGKPSDKGKGCPSTSSSKIVSGNGQKRGGKFESTSGCMSKQAPWGGKK